MSGPLVAGQPAAWPAAAPALELRAATGPDGLALTERPVVAPAPTQVLVRVAAAPVNPSDLAFLAGSYGARRPLPTVPGFEGSGTVIAAGGSPEAQALLGRRVAFAAGSDGCWAAYTTCAARACVPLTDEVSLEEGASLMINPTTAWALLALAAPSSPRAIVQTAAGSSLGRMIARLARRRGVAVVQVVRRPAAAEVLRAAGEEHVLDSSAPDFESALAARTAALGAHVALDAVGGAMTSCLVRALPAASRVVVYGALAGDAAPVSALDLIFGDKSIEGFWLASWLRRLDPSALTAVRAGVQERLGDDLRTDYAARLSLAEAPARLGELVARGAGKVLLVP